VIPVVGKTELDKKLCRTKVAAYLLQNERESEFATFFFFAALPDSGKRT